VLGNQGGQAVADYSLYRSPSMCIGLFRRHAEIRLGTEVSVERRSGRSSWPVGSTNKKCPCISY